MTLGVVLSRMEALPSPKFATAKSGLPSPLKSPMLTDLESMPVAKKTWGAKEGVVAPVAVVLSRMEAVPLPPATAKSGLPSPLKSPMLRDWAPLAAKETWGAKEGVVAPVAVVLSRMEASLLFKFAVAKSGFPSPLMSPMLTETGPLAVAKSTLGAKLGVVAPAGVVLSRMEALLLKRFAVTKSDFPSPLMSPMLTKKGPLAVAKVTWEAKEGVVAPVGVVLSRMEAVVSSLFATAKSGFPSPLKSPMLTETEPVAVAKSTLGAKEGVVAPVGVVLSRMEALLLPMFAVAKSGFPSPLKSPMLTDLGSVPVVNKSWGSKVGGKVGMAAPVGVVLSRM